MFKCSMLLVLFVVSLQIQTGFLQLATCAGGQPDCDAPAEPNSICVNGKCACIATYADVSNDCVQIDCSSDASVCGTDDSNSFCHSSNVCNCKTNFVGTGVEDCTRKSCTTNVDCKATASTYCATAGCTCGSDAPADATTGVCTPKTCTLANVATTCAGTAKCIATTSDYQCLCPSISIPGASDCVSKPCSADADCTSSDSQTSCDTTNSICVCKAGFLASGSRCKKDCSSATCGTSATCTALTTDSTTIKVCECNVNYGGDGATCTQLSCSGTDASNCHPNSKCVSDACTCNDGFTADGTMCRKSCSAATDCSSNAICLSDKCQCKQNYAGDGNTCTQKTCSVIADCSGSNTNCTAAKCTCATGYEVSSTAVECVMSPTTTAAATNATTTASCGNGAEKIASYNAVMVFVGYKILCSLKNLF